MRSWERIRAATPLLRATLVVAVALGLLSAPVECALAAGPHSIFQTPSGVAEASADPHAHHQQHAAASTNRTDPAHAHHDHGAAHEQHADASGSALSGADEFAPAPAREASSRIASVSSPSILLTALGSGGLDQVIPFTNLLGDPLATPRDRDMRAVRSETLPSGLSHLPELPPPQPSSLI